MGAIGLLLTVLATYHIANFSEGFQYAPVITTFYLVGLVVQLGAAIFLLVAPQARYFKQRMSEIRAQVKLEEKGTK